MFVVFWDYQRVASTDFRVLRAIVATGFRVLRAIVATGFRVLRTIVATGFRVLVHFEDNCIFVFGFFLSLPLSWLLSTHGILLSFVDRIWYVVLY